MKTFATLAALLGAALPAQILDWRDVRMAAVSAQPIAVGNEIGILFVSDARTPFVFHNSTSQQLRVHEVYWYLLPCCGIQQETIKLIGHETTCQQTAWSFPWSRYPVYPNVLGRQSVDFVLENLTGNYCYYPRQTAWNLSTNSSAGPTLFSAWLVTAVGGW